MGQNVRKGLALISGVMLLMLLFATWAFSASPSPQKGGILKIASRDEAPTLNSMIAQSIHVITFSSPVFNGLVMVDPTQEEVSVEKVVPSLAEKWTISPDGKVYTFYLRRGVKFHDGRPFTAKDVKYSLDFLADPAKSQQASNVAMMDKVEVADDYTVKVSLKHPYPPFLLYLCFPYCVMLPVHLQNVSPKSPDFLVGTGPFKFKNRIPGKVWLYEKNPDYFIKGLPYLDGIEIYRMQWDAAVTAFCGGRLSMGASIRYGIEEKGVLDKVRRYVPEAIVKMKPLGILRGVMFNFDGSKRKGPWQDVRVRRAMALVIDFPGSIVAGQGSPELGIHTGIVPPYLPTGLPWKEVEKLMGIDRPMGQRINEAKRLMREAGYPDGFKAEMVLRNSAGYVKASEFIAQGWRKQLGIQVELKILDNAVFFPARDTGDFDFMYEAGGHSRGGAPDEELAYFASEAYGNHGKWSNAEYDRLYGELLREINPKKRTEISERMQRLFLSELPFIPNVCHAVGTAYRPTLHGHVMHPGHTNWACFDRIWMEK